MGSFWGHMDEGIFFLVISVWWMFHIYIEYVMKSGRTGDIRLPFTYGCPRYSHIPIETFVKIVFPLCGFCAEFLADGFFNFTDPNGNFKNIENIQHMSIYAMFILHGLSDLFLWYRWPVVRDAHLMTVTAAFLWYGVAFIFHAHMEGKEPLETIVHLVPLPVLFGAAACTALRLFHKDGVALPLALTFCVFTLGTWFCHVPYMLYSHKTFPGREPSDWDRSDPRNVAFAVAMFGTHICFNVIFMWVLYVIVYVVMTKLRLATPFALPYEEETSKYQRLRVYDDQDDSSNSMGSNMDLIKS